MNYPEEKHAEQLLAQGWLTNDQADALREKLKQAEFQRDLTYTSFSNAREQLRKLSNALHTIADNVFQDAFAPDRAKQPVPPTSGELSYEELTAIWDEAQVTYQWCDEPEIYAMRAAIAAALAKQPISRADFLDAIKHATGLRQDEDYLVSRNAPRDQTEPYEVVHIDTVAKIAALAKRPVQQVPDGWKLVPIEPTEAMQDAWHCAAYQSYEQRGPIACGTHKAMLAAAPTPPVQESRDE